MLDKIIIIRDYLNAVKTRCTYNAAAQALGIKPAEFKKLLDERSPENSWFVNTGAGDPVGYSDDEKHPELYRTTRIIKSAEVLTRNLDLQKRTGIDKWGYTPFINMLDPTRLILSIGTMMTGNKFNADQIQALLDELNTTGSGWHIDKGKVTKQFVFNDFSTAFGFMTLCAIYAEKINHHPEWFNVYNKVNVQLMTHEVSGISDKDADLAKQMDLYAYKLAKQ